MTLMALPQATRSCTRTSNYLERLNAKVKRQAKVVSVFLSKGSLIRLVGTYLIEENDRWAAKSKQYWLPTIKEVERRKGDLEEIARTQRRMRLAYGLLVAFPLIHHFFRRNRCYPLFALISRSYLGP
jgi:hypothetical protein